jgi:RNA polymerase sigma factor (sigma-70 family)
METLFNEGTFGSLTDGQLLERFASRQPGADAALEALVLRHGSAVLGVCRAVLDDSHDAEDAFQATFLVLIRKAPAIRRRESVGSWLYGVAQRVALRARADAARRRKHEKTRSTMWPEAHVADDEEHSGPALTRALHEEIHRLPEKYRAPVVLCWCEGLTHDLAAQQLGWPVGTVSGRLTRARALLQKRLRQRGHAPLIPGLWGAIGGEGCFRTTVPTSLVEMTVRNAVGFGAGSGALSGAVSVVSVSLAEGVLQTMFLTKIKVVSAVVVAAGMIATGAGVIASQKGEGKAPDAKPAPDARIEQAEAPR